MKVAVAQMKCVTYEKEENFKIAKQLILKAVERGARLVVLPELFNTGYCCVSKDWELAESVGGVTEQFLKNLAIENNISIMGGFVEKSAVKGLVYNSLMFVSAASETKVYRKIYLWGAEKNRFISGNSLSHWEHEGIDIGPQICYELGFSENAKALSLEGAELLIYSSAFGAARYYAWDINSKARALETGCYLLASNHSGVEGDIVFCGASRIVDPQGNIIAETVADNDIAIADIDIEKVYEQRSALPYLRDIKLDMITKEFSNIKR